MLWIDSAIPVLVGLFAIGGLIRGTRRELFSVFSWSIGIVVGWFFSQNFALLLIKAFTEITHRYAVAFAALLAITVLNGWIIGQLSSGKSTKLALMQRLGGACLGSIHGLLVVFAVILLAGLTPLPKDSWWRQSIYIPYFQGFAVNLKQHSVSKLAAMINYSPRLNLQIK